MEDIKKWVNEHKELSLAAAGVIIYAVAYRRGLRKGYKITSSTIDYFCSSIEGLLGNIS